jgi:hypothetical protein
MSGPPPDESPFSFLKLIAEAAAVFIGLTFVSGWSYLASYYKTFGLNPIELDVSVPVVTTIALHMLFDSVWPVLIAAVLLAVIAAARRFPWWHVNQRGLILSVLIVISFCAAGTGLFRGRAEAGTDMLEESATLPLVAFSSKSSAVKSETADQLPCIAFETFGQMECKLLLHSKGMYYFFRPIPTILSGKADKLDLYALSDSEVLGVHIQRGLVLPRLPK